MNGLACVDASIAVKWVVTEDDTPQGLQFLREALSSATRIVAPLHFRAEVTSAIYRRVRLGELVPDEARTAIAEFEAISVELVNPLGLNLRAIELSLQFRWKHPYDAFYLALGELVDCDVWTADQDFFNDAHVKYPRLRLLSQFVP